MLPDESNKPASSAERADESRGAPGNHPHAAEIGGDLFAADPSVPPPSEPSSFASERPFRILIADDNEVNRNVIRTIVERLGYRPVEACNGSEALERVVEGEANCVFTDIDMPEMDGVEAAIAIRAHEKTAASNLAKTEIIAVTANTSPDIRTRCRAAGMNGFLEKPVDEAIVRKQLLTSWRRFKRRAASR